MFHQRVDASQARKVFTKFSIVSLFSLFMHTAGCRSTLRDHHVYWFSTVFFLTNKISAHSEASDF